MSETLEQIELEPEVTEPIEDHETPQEATQEPVQAEETPEPDHDDGGIGKLRQAYRDAKRQARALAAENEVLKGTRQQQPNEELDRKAREYATQIASQEAFNQKCNTIYTDGVKAYGRSGFDRDVQEVNETLGGAMPGLLVEAMDDAGDAAKILHYFAEHPDELEDVANLQPHKLGAAVSKIAHKLNAPKAVSRTPAPIRPVSGGGTSGPVNVDKMPLDQYMAYMDERDVKRRRGDA